MLQEDDVVDTQQADPPTRHLELDAQSKLVAVFDALIDPVVILSAVRDQSGTIVDFRCIDANPAACTDTHLPYETLVGETLLDLFPGHAATGLLDRYIAVVETGEPLVLDDYPYLSEFRGEERLYDIRAVRIDDSLVYTWRDVTERLERDRARATVLSVEALADERDRVARDLHDGAIQEVYGTAMSLNVIAADSPPDVRARLEPVIEAQDAIIRHLRATVLGLTRPDLSESNVTSLMARTISEAERSLGFVPDLRLEGDLESLTDPLLVEHLLVSLREMLSNVARHAHANSVEVAVIASPTAVEVVVTDDGVGIDDSTTKGYGLSNLAKRAALLGGAFSLVGRPEGGVCARWRVPRTSLGRMLAAS
jgi:signal transduction histidine kinase